MVVTGPPLLRSPPRNPGSPLTRHLALDLVGAPPGTTRCVLIGARFGRPPNGYEVRDRRTSGAAVGTSCMSRAVRTAHVDLSVHTYATMLVEPDHEQPALQRAPSPAASQMGIERIRTDVTAPHDLDLARVVACAGQPSPLSDVVGSEFLWPPPRRTNERANDACTRKSGRDCAAGARPLPPLRRVSPAADHCDHGGHGRPRRSTRTWPTMTDRIRLARRAVHSGLPNHQVAPASDVCAK